MKLCRQARARHELAGGVSVLKMSRVEALKRAGLQKALGADDPGLIDPVPRPRPGASTADSDRRLKLLGLIHLDLASGRCRAGVGTVGALTGPSIS